MYYSVSSFMFLTSTCNSACTTVCLLVLVLENVSIVVAGMLNVTSLLCIVVIVLLVSGDMFCILVQCVV
jgi:hypothetical protein